MEAEERRDEWKDWKRERGGYQAHLSKGFQVQRGATGKEIAETVFTL